MGAGDSGIDRGDLGRMSNGRKHDEARYLSWKNKGTLVSEQVQRDAVAVGQAHSGDGDSTIGCTRCGGLLLKPFRVQPESMELEFRTGVVISCSI